MKHTKYRNTHQIQELGKPQKRAIEARSYRPTLRNAWNIPSLVSRKSLFRRSFVWLAGVIIIVLLPIVVLTLWKGQIFVRAIELKLDEASGTAVNDVSGSVAAGTITNAVWRTKDECLNTNCLYFDGSDDYVTFGDDADLDLTAAGTYTISFWMRRGPVSAPDFAAAIFKFGDGTNGGYYVGMWPSGVISFAIGDDNASFPEDYAASTTTYNDNRWHHVAAVKNGTTGIYLYVDGKLVGSDETLATTGTLANSAPFYIGSWGGSIFDWEGYIDEVKVLNAAYTPPQIYSLMEKDAGPEGAAAQFGLAPMDIFTNGLVGWWKMDETSWTNDCATNAALDSSGNANHGHSCPNTSGSTTPIKGKFDNSGNFDGTDDSIDIPHTADFLPAGDFTLATWVKLDTLPSVKGETGYLMFKIGAAQEAYSLYVGMGANKPVFRWNNDTSSQYYAGSGTALTTDVWYHIVAVKQKNEIRLYLNGRIDGDVTATTGTIYSNSSGVLAFARDGLGNNLDGSMDEARFFNRALSPFEVRMLYEYAPGPFAWWKLDENSGSTAYDVSGNGADGTLNNSPKWQGGKFGAAVWFDGGTQSISATITDPGYSNTVEAWLYPTDGEGPYMTGTVANKTLITSGKLTTDANSKLNYGSCVGTTIVLNQWTHVVGISTDATHCYLYQDGILTASNTTGVTFGTSVSLADSSYMGKMDDVRIYNYPRTQAQIIEDMNAGHPGLPSAVGSAVGYWKFDEGAGATANNSGFGPSMSGTLSGATTPSWSNAGKIGKALSFNGTTSYITMGNPTAAQLSSDLTITAWVNLTANNVTQNILGRYGNSGNYSYMCRVGSTGKLRMYVSNDGTAQIGDVGTTTLQTGTWYHVACVYKAGSRIELYINGRIDGETTASIPATPYIGTANLTIGANSSGGSDPFNGLIDEAKLYPFALTGEQVQLDYNQAKSAAIGSTSTDATGVGSNAGDRVYCPPGDATGNCAAGQSPSPVAEWRFEENTSTNTYDTSGNNLSTTETGTPTWTAGKYGSAFQYNGSSQQVTATLGSDPGYTNTVEAWVYPTTSVASKTIVTDSKLITDASSRPTYGTCVGTALSLNAWTHIVAVSNGASVCQIYQDGVLTASNTTGVTFGTSVDIASSSFIGKIDDVRIFNYVRTLPQVAWSYNKGAPILSYKFDECTGTDVYNSARNGNGAAMGRNGVITIGGSGDYTAAGTCAGSATDSWKAGATGKFGSALALDGTNDYVSVASPVLPTGDFTYAAWIKYDTSTGNGIFMAPDSSGNNEIYYYTSSDKIIAYVNNTAAIVGNKTLTSGTWYHVVLTRSGGVITSYINGVLDSTGSDIGTLAFSTCSLYIGLDIDAAASCGAGTEGNYFDGLIDDARVYNYALNPTQIRILYNENSSVRQ